MCLSCARACWRRHHHQIFVCFVIEEERQALNCQGHHHPARPRPGREVGTSLVVAEKAERYGSRYVVVLCFSSTYYNRIAAFDVLFWQRGIVAGGDAGDGTHCVDDPPSVSPFVRPPLYPPALETFARSSGRHDYYNAQLTAKQSVLAG
jgi:hypothetical protein